MTVFIKTKNGTLINLNSIETIFIKNEAHDKSISIVAIPKDTEYEYVIFENFYDYKTAKSWFKSFCETLNDYLKHGGILDVKDIINYSVM